jgi:hypothetical protein
MNGFLIQGLFTPPLPIVPVTLHFCSNYFSEKELIGKLKAVDKPPINRQHQKQSRIKNPAWKSRAGFWFGNSLYGGLPNGESTICVTDLKLLVLNLR